MSGAPNPCPLSSALLGLLPGACLHNRKATGWHSATFSGERVAVQLSLEGGQRHERAAHFCASATRDGIQPSPSVGRRHSRQRYV